jgi:hypothetical protein
MFWPSCLLIIAAFAGATACQGEFISGRSFVFITPYKGKKSGAFQKKWLRGLRHVES